MKLEKSMLEKIDTITLALENCESFNISGKYILDFWTSEFVMPSRKEPETEVDDGCLIISKNAFKILSSAATEEYTDGTTGLDHGPEENFYLYNRIKYCCDVCQIYVNFKDGNILPFFVPYDPLESLLFGKEIDWSNCPSAELNEDGDLLILFGKSSRAYKRTDNNYFDLIIGLKDEIHQQLDQPLQGQIEKFSNSDSEVSCPRLFISMRLANKGLSGKYLELLFENVQKVSYDISFYQKGKRRLWMSRISTGEIFVEIEDICTFYCNGVEVHPEFAE